MEVLYACVSRVVCVCVLAVGSDGMKRKIVKLVSMLIMLLWFYEINEKHEEFVCCEL